MLTQDGLSMKQCCQGQCEAHRRRLHDIRYFHIIVRALRTDKVGAFSSLSNERRKEIRF